MSYTIFEEIIAQDPGAELERALMEEHLGGPLSGLKDLPKEEAKRLFTEASTYASCKRTEIEAKGHLSQEVKGAVASHGLE